MHPVYTAAALTSVWITSSLKGLKLPFSSPATKSNSHSAWMGWWADLPPPRSNSTVCEKCAHTALILASALRYQLSQNITATNQSQSRLLYDSLHWFSGLEWMCGAWWMKTEIFWLCAKAMFHEIHKVKYIKCLLVPKCFLSVWTKKRIWAKE